VIKVLVLVALLVTPAQADDDGPLVLLRRSFSERSGRGCIDLLATLRITGVPDSTTIDLPARRGLAAGRHTLAALRILCATRTREHLRDDMRGTIARAIEFPWVWAEACLTRWQHALASGVDPTARVEIGTRSRRGFVRVSGTLEELYEQHCENAYTPRRR
jgi:hypothetical protein